MYSLNKFTNLDTDVTSPCFYTCMFIYVYVNAGWHNLFIAAKPLWRIFQFVRICSICKDFWICVDFWGLKGWKRGQPLRYKSSIFFPQYSVFCTQSSINHQILNSQSSFLSLQSSVLNSPSSIQFLKLVFTKLDMAVVHIFHQILFQVGSKQKKYGDILMKYWFIPYLWVFVWNETERELSYWWSLASFSSHLYYASPKHLLDENWC